MIAQIEPIAARGNARICHLKAVLIGTKPPIWRRLQVPGNANLGWLHAVLQAAMGRTNNHLHQFKVGGEFYSDPRHHFTEYEDDPEILDESKFTLQELAPHAKDIWAGKEPGRKSVEAVFSPEGASFASLLANDQQTMKEHLRAWLR